MLIDKFYNCRLIQAAKKIDNYYYVSNNSSFLFYSSRAYTLIKFNFKYHKLSITNKADVNDTLHINSDSSNTFAILTKPYLLFSLHFTLEQQHSHRKMCLREIKCVNLQVSTMTSLKIIIITNTAA